MRRTKATLIVLLAMACDGSTAPDQPSTRSESSEAQLRVREIAERYGLPLGVTAVESAIVDIPSRADEPIRLHHAGSFQIEVRLVGARPSPRQVAEGLSIYPGAAEGGGDVLLRAGPNGVEDFVELKARPKVERVSYDVALGSGVAGLRLVNGVLEFLDEGGVPRLRANRPYVTDAHGLRHEARLELRGCQADLDARPPFRRAVTPPGARNCGVDVSFGGVDYPVLVDPAWTNTLTMQEVRYGHTATLLENGHVLVCGGFDDSSPVEALGTCEEYEPSSKAWANSYAMIARGYHTATLLDDNKTLVIAGGSATPGGGSFVDTVMTITTKDCGAPSSCTRSQALSESARSEHTAARIDAKRVLLVGGRYSTSLPALQSTVFIDFNVADDWKAAADSSILKTARYAHAMVTAPPPAADLVVVGGRPVGTGTPGATLGSVEVRTAGGWTEIGPIPKNATRARMGALVMGSSLYVAGGETSGGPGTQIPTSSVFRYDFVSKTWSTVPPASMATERSAFSLVALKSGQILAAGGLTTAQLVATSDTEVYSPTTDQWLPAGKMMWEAPGQAFELPRARYTATAVDAGNAILIAGGAMAVGGLAKVPASLFEQQANGAACSDAGQCTSGFCVGDVCCDQACDQPCDVCESGTCGELVCPTGEGCGAYACNGEDPAACHFVTTECVVDSCHDGIATKSTSCDGLGNCPTPMTTNCSPYVCDKASVTCATSCEVSAECAAGFDCVEKTCSAGCTEGGTGVKQPDGGTQDCKGYLCTAGTCLQTCNSNDECIAPHICDFGNKCVLPETASEDESPCGCELPGRARSAASRGWLLGALLLIFGIRRRSWTRASGTVRCQGGRTADRRSLSRSAPRWCRRHGDGIRGSPHRHG